MKSREMRKHQDANTTQQKGNRHRFYAVTLPSVCIFLFLLSQQVAVLQILSFQAVIKTIKRRKQSFFILRSQIE